MQGNGLVRVTTGAVGNGEVVISNVSWLLVPQTFEAAQINVAPPVPNVRLMLEVVLEPDQPVPVIDQTNEVAPVDVAL